MSIGDKIIKEVNDDLITSIRSAEYVLGIKEVSVEGMNSSELNNYLSDLLVKCQQQNQETAHNKEQGNKKSKKMTHVSEKDCTDTESTTGKIPDVSQETIAELPDDINQLLQKVAERYDVTAKAIYEQYLDLKERLGDYPLSRFKLVLESSVDGCSVFEGGIVRAIKLKYTDSIVYGKLRLYKLTEDNSKYDIIRECHKAEGILYDLGQLPENKIISNRIKQVGNARLDKVKAKSELLGYFDELYYRIGERLAIQND